MLKYFFLCRHAHTPEAQPNQSDFDRALSETGIQEAKQAGAFIKSFNLTIDAFLFSAAVRTCQTAQIIAEVLNYNLNQLKPRQELYYPSVATILKEITTLPETVQTVILVTHNPAVSRLVSDLTNNQVYVPTGGCNLFISEGPDWESVEWSPFTLKINY